MEQQPLIGAPRAKRSRNSGGFEKKMTNAVNIDVTTAAGTTEALAAAIDARTRALGKSTEDSSVAAAITILRSLKSSTKKAPVKKVPPGAYSITKTNLIGCVTKNGPRRIGCKVKGGKVVSNIRPAIGYEPGSVSPWKTSVYRIVPSNPNVRFGKCVNAQDKCWYVLAQDEGQARNWADRRFIGQGMFRGILLKESGMARAALAMAQAKASTKSKVVTKEAFSSGGTMSANAAAIAYDAGSLTVKSSGFGSGSCEVSFYDALRYSAPAAGETAVQVAMAKAANSMLGAYGGAEMKAALENLRVTNPEAKFVDIFKRKFAR